MSQKNAGNMQKHKIAVIGSGISGLSCAWLLAKAHHVTLFEKDLRLGGHAHTEVVDGTPVDVGFIVYNESTYPNLTALFRHLNVPTRETRMGFSVSLRAGAYEYSGGSLSQILGSPRHAISRQHWSMLSDLTRFYRKAKQLSCELDDDVTLGTFLRRHHFGEAFVNNHLVPMAAAIWSSQPGLMLDYPAKAFIDFFDNHQLLRLGGRKKWRTVVSGAKSYVERMRQSVFAVCAGDPVFSVMRSNADCRIVCASGRSEVFDHVVFASHADQTLSMLSQPSAEETALLSQFNYSKNRVFVHSDVALMPKALRHWSSWNYVGNGEHAQCGVTYWMNSLQNLETKRPLFVSLNPPFEPNAERLHMTFDCTHPIFSPQTLRAQKSLWKLQGCNNTWFCGAYFGAGFHEDGLQAGLAVAEALGGVRRPWRVANESNRIFAGPDSQHMRTSKSGVR